MFKTNTTAIRFGVSAAVVVSLVLSLVLPLLTSSSSIVLAEQVSARSITMDDSTANAASVKYDLSFNIPATSSTTGIEAVVLQYCTDSPIVGVACNDAVEAADGFNWNDTAATAEGGTCAYTAGDFDTDATKSDADGLVWDNGATAVDAITPACTIDITFDGVDNPDTAKSFYVRIHVYDEKDDIPYTGAGTDFDEDNGTLLYDDYGGVALATTNNITLEARVQERLDFDVSTDANGDDCASYAGTTIDLGVLDSSTINRASTHSIAGNVNVICTEVITNASGGVVIAYTTTDFKVSGASCSEDDMDIGAVSTDQCLNWDEDSTGANNGLMAAGTEQWGLGIISTPQNGSTADAFGANLTADYDETSWTGTVFAAPDATSPVTLATSGGAVVDAESLEIDVAGTAAIVTPTGLYGATLMFVATSTF